MLWSYFYETFFFFFFHANVNLIKNVLSLTERYKISFSIAEGI